MRHPIIATLAVLALLPFQAFAAATADTFDLRNAADLVELCDVPESDPMADASRGFCYGFLSGAGSYHRAITSGKNARPLFCPPQPRVSRAEAARLFVGWGRGNPQYLTETPVDALIRFAVVTWPCPQAQR
jgi:Ssp1 endopeptidase immunity protein Rap1a